MQHALQPSATDLDVDAGSAHSAPRKNKFLIAGAAMIGAGAIAATPVAPTTPDVYKERAVELAAAANPLLGDPTVVVEQTATSTFANLQALAVLISENPSLVSDPAALLETAGATVSARLAALAALGSADPVALLSDFIQDQARYLDLIVGAPAPADAPPRVRGTGILGSLQGVQRTNVLLQERLAAASAYAESGDLTAAFAEVESALLIGFENIAQPFLSAAPIPGEILGIPELTELITRSNSVGITRGLLAPPITLGFAFANVADTLANAVEAGDYEGALTALVNTPAFTANAFLNGYQPALTYDADNNVLTSATEAFQGVFTPRRPAPTPQNPNATTPGGTIDQFFVTLPRAIAAALAPAPAASAPSTGSTAGIASTGSSATPALTVAVPSAGKVKEKEKAAKETADTTTATKKPTGKTTRVNPVKQARDNFRAAVKEANDGLKNAVTGGKHASGKDAAPSAADSTPKHAKTSGSDNDSE